VIHESEHVVVQKVLGGDGAAFEELLAPIEGGLRNFIRSRLRSRPEVPADDVLQEVRIYLYERLDRYNPEYPLAVFARGLAANVIKRFLYKRSDLLPPSSDPDEDDPGWEERLSPRELAELPRNLRDVIGDGRFDSPKGAPEPSREFLELFELFLRYGGYPHQQVCFGFSILLWGRPKRPLSGTAEISFQKVPITGDPDRVVQLVGPKRLAGSSAEMLEEVRVQQKLDADYLRRVRDPLDRRLDLTGAELFERDVVSRKQFVPVIARVIGETELREYFGKDQRKSVADWTHSVKERIKRVVLDPASRDRLPLPFKEDPREP
jgi:hypothetical protein